MAKTTSVAITVTLNSTSSGPPYDMNDCQCVISQDDGTSSTLTGWGQVKIPVPVNNGAQFSLAVRDSGFNSATNPSSIVGWALTFLPRPGTSQASPFGNNVNTLTGGAVSGTGNLFPLNVGNSKIKQSGGWDWVLMAQVNTGPAGQQAIKCFASDPEMEVEF